MVPFFTSFLLRTLAWETIFADSGRVLSWLHDLHLIPFLNAIHVTTDAGGGRGRIMNTQTAVVGGLTYNFLPFALLPIYVSLEKVDKGLVEAANDLYSSFGRAFRKVILPLSLPGVFAGTLLTFIPATGDFINALLLGTPRQFMIGNVIQSRFLELNDYPAAASLSFVLMAAIVVMVFVYARVLGTEKLTG
jgi:spermidine/putrescine transport system permease protein